MKPENDLKEILDSLHFTQYEQDAFKQAISIASDFMKDGNIDIEDQFEKIVEEVVSNAIQEDYF